MQICDLHAGYRAGAFLPSDCIAEVLRRIAAADRDEIWISRVDEATLLSTGAELDRLLKLEGPGLLDRYPLFGVPFAIKDNIDLLGLPTTAACPEFAFVPGVSARAVSLLTEGHAVPIGKTNLDQFATGLVGTRSPYGPVRNAIDPAYISGGSSSGSAVSVALGLVAFSFGTDTAGSGRVPAGLNGIVGIKPSRGLISTSGMLPACRSLDCISIFANDVADAWRVLGVVAQYDADDTYSRRLPMSAPLVRTPVFGIHPDCEFFGDVLAEDAYRRSLEQLDRMPGVARKMTDAKNLFAAAELLYQGPWLAERQAAIGDFMEANPAAMDPSVRTVISAAGKYSAVDAFRAEYRMAEYRQEARELFEQVDVLLVPTAPTHPRLEAVLADPIRLNSQMGYYTNFVNLLDLAAIAIPALPRSDGLPFGLTLIGPAGSDHRLAVLAAKLMRFFRDGAEPGNTAATIAAAPLAFAEPTMPVVVAGAHLSGLPLNWQLIGCGARLLTATRTAPEYRLYALANTQPPKPGLARVGEGGAAIEVEIWEMPRSAFGDFMLQVGAPMGIGTVKLENGESLKGFICEPAALEGAVDITVHGGWRAYLAHTAAHSAEGVT